MIPINTRVKWVDGKGAFLSNGYVKEHIKCEFTKDFFCYIIKLDKKAPNTYAYETDQVMAFEGEVDYE